MIDVVVFATNEACKVIDKADYNKDFAAISQELSAAQESPKPSDSTMDD